MNTHETDFSIRSAPESWSANANASPMDADNTPLRRRRLMPRVPIREQPDMVTSTLFGGAAAFLVGWTWYDIEASAGAQSPWIAPILGIVIALGVRLGNGRHHADLRATLSTVLYLTTLLCVAYLGERHAYMSLYGSSNDFWVADRALLINRIAVPGVMGFWFIGLVATIQTSYLTGRSHK